MLICNKNYQQKFDEVLKGRSFNTNKFSNQDNNKFNLLLRKGVYRYEYMNGWENSMKHQKKKRRRFLPSFMEDVTDADYAHTKRVCKDFEIKDLGEYQDLYVQSNTLLLADIFENFRNMCLKIYGLDPTHFLSTPGLTWQAALKIDSSKIRYFS